MCENPVSAWLDTSVVNEKTGKNPLLFKLPPEASAYYVTFGSYPSRYCGVSVPCGKCFSCRRDRAWNLTVRASFEARLYDHSTFITLTVADCKINEVFPNGVVHRPWQLFAKRLRKKIGSFRFLMCAEYGSQTFRPHYHAIIFGHRLDDVGLLPDGTWIPSLTLAECWPYGHVQAADVNECRVAYVAGYTLKDYQLGRDKEWYQSRGLNLPYVKWSRRPGLGAAYFDRWYSSLIKRKDLWLKDEHYDQYLTTAVFGNNKRYCACRYFSERLQLLSPSLYDKIKASKSEIPHEPLKELLRAEDNIRASLCRQHALELRARDIS